MEFSLNAETLSKPWFRAVVGIILIVAGFLAVTSQSNYSGITRENCIEAEVTLYEFRVNSADVKFNRGVWFIFDDYDRSLSLHSSCVSDKLMSDVLKLEKGTEMKVLYSEKNGTIYEMSVNGEQWLDFDTANSEIAGNIAILKYGGYVLLPVGAVLAASAFIKKGKNKETCSE